MKKYVCPICGYVHEGNEPPEKCPQCGCAGTKFLVKEATDKMTWACEHEIGVAKGLDAASEEGRKAMLDIIQQEVDSYKKGGKHEGMFPERWLPTAVGICDEEFTIANKMMNSTMKIVRGKVEEHYASLLDYLYTPEGKDIKNPRNLEALK